MHWGMDPRSQKAAQFASAFIYGQEYDFAVKQAVRHQQSLEEVLAHSTIEQVWRQIVSAAAPPAIDMEVDNTASKSDLLCNFVEPESLSKLQLPEHANKLQTVENAAELARRMVRSQIQTVDGSQSLEKLCKLMRAMELTKLRGGSDNSFLVIYSVDAAGEHEKDSRRSPTPARRDHMEKVVRAVMTTRAAELPNFEDLDKIVYPQLDASDVWHVFTTDWSC